MSEDIERMIGTRPRKLSKGVYVRLLRNKEGRLELAVIIGDDTSAEELRRAWPILDRERTRLRRVQGSDMQTTYNVLMYRYEHMKATGWSYGAIAMDANYDCLVNLCGAAEEVPDADAPVIISRGFSNAYHLLKVFRMKDEEIINDWLIPGLHAIHEGAAPWALDDRGPVSWLRVRDALRQWRQEQESGQIVIKAPPKSRTEDLQEAGPVDTRTQKADELLRRTYPQSFAKYEKLLKKSLLAQKAKGADVIIVR
jgi:hypothetical protein